MSNFARKPAPFYVVDFNSSPAFCVNLDGYHTEKEARRAQRWMEVGQGAHDDWRVAKRIAPDVFQCVGSKETATAGACCYRAEVWDGFLASFDGGAK